jgi:hypothetical protein
MAKRLDAESQGRLLCALEAVLEQARVQRRTLTYLEVADQLAVPGPQRIHKTTRLLEILLKQDVENGRIARSALAVSRVGRGRPAAGFFDRARRLGIWDGQDPDGFHDRLLERLFDRSRP